jgi:hypothetical protein
MPLAENAAACSCAAGILSARQAYLVAGNFFISSINRTSFGPNDW